MGCGLGRLRRAGLSAGPAMACAPVFPLGPGDPDTPTGGFVYDRHAARGLAETDRLGGVLRVDGPFPATDADTLARAAAALATVPDGAGLVVDGLAFAPLIDLPRPHAARLTLGPDGRRVGKGGWGQIRTGGCR